MKKTNLRFALIGMNMFIFPPDPKIGDFEALKKWELIKVGFWQTLKFRIKFKYWSYAIKYDG